MGFNPSNHNVFDVVLSDGLKPIAMLGMPRMGQKNIIKISRTGIKLSSVFSVVKKTKIL
jgi:hypothetical protein